MSRDKKDTWYSMQRGWMDHAIFKNEEYTHREAWCWLIENAVYESISVDIFGTEVVLERGQLSYSQTYLAKAWKWNRPRVQRFLKRLEKWNFIEQKTDQGQSVITICNYKKYQGRYRGGRTEIEPAAIKQRSGSDHNNNKTNKTKESIIIYSEEFERFWLPYPRKKGKKSANKSFTQALKTYSAPQLVESSINYAKAMKVEKREEQHIAHASTFLNKDYVADYLGTSPPVKPVVMFRDEKEPEWRV